jgi:hypothetical protein
MNRITDTVALKEVSVCVWGGGGQGNIQVRFVFFTLASMKTVFRAVVPCSLGELGSPPVLVKNTVTND